MDQSVCGDGWEWIRISVGMSGDETKISFRAHLYIW